MHGTGSCSENCPISCILFDTHKDIHLGKNGVFNYLNLEPNSILQTNTKYFLHMLNRSKLSRNILLEIYHKLFNLMSSNAAYGFWVSIITHLYQSAFIAFSFILILHIGTSIWLCYYVYQSHLDIFRLKYILFYYKQLCIYYSFILQLGIVFLFWNHVYM